MTRYMGSPSLRIAGIGMHWTEDYAKAYRDKLQEMGFHSKKVIARKEDGTTIAYVAYSVFGFTLGDVERLVGQLSS